MAGSSFGNQFRITTWGESHGKGLGVVIVPGIRPGKPTSDYLNRILNYLIFIGACGLTIVCVLPYVFNGVFGASVSFGGTSLIIIVSVLLETLKQIESQMMVRNYKGFLND